MTSKSKRATADADKLVGERIRTARLEAQMSQETLGTALGISFQQIQKYEKGMNRVSIGRLMQIGQAVNKPLEFFSSGLGDGVKFTAEQRERSAFLATREGDQIIRAMIDLSPYLQQCIINLARELRGDEA
jgi:transcriptional regulator with XRE-family HTH domain